MVNLSKIGFSLSPVAAIINEMKISIEERRHFRKDLMWGYGSPYSDKKKPLMLKLDFFISSLSERVSIIILSWGKFGSVTFYKKNITS